MNDFEIRRFVLIDDKDRATSIFTIKDIGYNVKSVSEELAIKYFSLARGSVRGRI